MPHNNPFIHGNPVAPEQLLGRKNELYTIAGRISTGQSTAVTGSPRSGKTSILKYLETETLLYDPENPEKPITLYDEDIKEKLIFSYLDAYSWGTKFKPIDFWNNALKRIQDKIKTHEELYKTYQNCQKNHFDNFLIEKLIDQIRNVDKRLVLIIDGFEELLNHSSEDWNAQFFGSLRTLASRSSGALVLVIAANKSLSHLQKEVQEFTKTNSPYFNFIYEVRLGALPEISIDILLKPGNFTLDDADFLKDIAGGHPYLLQVAASILWSSDEKEDNLLKRQQKVVEAFYMAVHDDLSEIWQSWPSTLQQAFSSVTLAQLSNFKNILKKQGIDVDSISRYIPPLKLNLEILKYYGFVTEDENIAGGWRVVPRIFLPFVLLNLKPKYRDKLPKTVWDCLFKAKETPDKNSKSRWFRFFS
ncbi:conserved hypothetical protein [Beggiatoa sp. PS]|nr:conserved hypothetical protein [Beggiatoa sp. PS]